jgi:hypothetical protein
MHPLNPYEGKICRELSFVYHWGPSGNQLPIEVMEYHSQSKQPFLLTYGKLPPSTLFNSVGSIGQTPIFLKVECPPGTQAGTLPNNFCNVTITIKDKH